MKHIWMKCAAIVMVIALVGSSVFFTRPQKSEAIIQCFLGSILGGLLGGGGGTASAGLVVPVGDYVNLPSHSTTATQTTGSTTKECVLDFLVNTLANTMIQNFTASIVEWINSGFEGSPSFVTNPEGFLGDVADQVIGQSIYQLGPIGEILCSPFDLQIRLALGLQYSSSYRRRISCRLSDIQQNIQNAFTRGNFNAGGNGWQNWISVTANPNNNPYGAFLETTAEIDARIISATGREIKLLDFGKGFMSFRKCTARGPSTVTTGANGQQVTQAGPCIQSEIVTPGSVIENQLNQQLGSPTRKLELADEINEIVGALVNQFVKMAFSSVGLGGLSGSGAGGGPSYTAQLVQSYEDALAQQTQTTARPEGITMSCIEFDSLIFTVNRNENTVSATRIDNIGNVSQVPLNRMTSSATTAWTVGDYDAVRAYCESADRYLDGPSNDYLNNTWETVATTTPDFSTIGSGASRNLAHNQAARQSRNHGNYYSADKAVNGQTMGDSNYWSAAAIAEKAPGDSNPWWEVTLNQDSYIEEIRIHKRTDENYQNSLGRFTVAIYDSNRNLTRTPIDVDTSADNVVPIVLRGVNATGRVVRISRLDGGTYLQLAEVEVSGNTRGIGASRVPGGNSAPFSLSFSPPTTSLSLTRNQVRTNSLTLTATGDRASLKGQIRIERNWNGSYSSVSFGSILTGFVLEIGDVLANPPNARTINVLSTARNNTTFVFDPSFAITPNSRVNINQRLTPTYYYSGYGNEYRIITEIIDPAANNLVLGRQVTTFSVGN